MSDDQQKNESPEYTSGGKRPFVSTYDNAPSLKVGDSVYLLNTDGSREGPYLVATAPVSGQCTLCYDNGSPFRNNADIDVDELEAC
ncbi:uncharacterized protein FMAN_10917 [Fusarium mangiferae]|uniref:Uncharacterized protein n=1 Tax=Fusarium mangiferae TaxID=192010 RepID=A0A1L7TP62_FUSMA|nr:uncharacterized protein FMAN_10917 [Fusarium mangiferae]CVK96576.1 uncharacterized protein FMAN_10917 [Fusarium mangiferae]